MSGRKLVQLARDRLDAFCVIADDVDKQAGREPKVESLGRIAARDDDNPLLVFTRYADGAPTIDNQHRQRWSKALRPQLGDFATECRQTEPLPPAVLRSNISVFVVALESRLGARTPAGFCFGGVH